MKQHEYVLALLMKNVFITPLEVIEKSKKDRLFIVHPEGAIAALRRKYGRDTIKTRRAENIHNTATHAQWYISAEDKKKIK